MEPSHNTHGEIAACKIGSCAPRLIRRSFDCSNFRGDVFRLIFISRTLIDFEYTTTSNRFATDQALT